MTLGRLGIKERMRKEYIVIKFASNHDAANAERPALMSETMETELANLAEAILDCHLEELAIGVLAEAIFELSPADNFEVSPAQNFGAKPKARAATDRDAGSWPL
jgi:hypothetical protein